MHERNQHRAIRADDRADRRPYQVGASLGAQPGAYGGRRRLATVSEKMHAAQAMLDDVRALLDEAKDALEDDAEASANVTVNLV